MSAKPETFEKILANKSEGGKTSYLVKFKDKCYSASRWIQEHDLQNSEQGAEMLHNYHTFAVPVTAEPYFDPAYTEIDRIVLAEKKRFLVKWKKLDYDNLTWESRVNSDVLDDFKRRQELKFPDLGALAKPIDADWVPDLEGHQEVSYKYIVSSYNNRTSVQIRKDFNDSLVHTLTAFMNSLYESGTRGPFLVLANFTTLTVWEDSVRNSTLLSSLVFVGDSATRELVYSMEFNSFNGPLRFHVLLTTPEIYKHNMAQLSRVHWNLLILEDVTTTLPSFDCFTVRLKTMAPKMRYNFIHTLLKLNDEKSTVEEKQTQKFVYKLPSMSNICRVALSAEQQRDICTAMIECKEHILNGSTSAATLRIKKILTSPASNKYGIAVSLCQDLVEQQKTVLVVGTILDHFATMCDSAGLRYFRENDFLSYRYDDDTHIFLYDTTSSQLDIVPDEVIVIDGEFQPEICLTSPKTAHQIGALYRLIYGDINEFAELDIKNCFYQATRQVRTEPEFCILPMNQLNDFYGTNLHYTAILNSPHFYSIMYDNIEGRCGTILNSEPISYTEEWSIIDRNIAVRFLMQLGFGRWKDMKTMGKLPHTTDSIRAFSKELIRKLLSTVDNEFLYPLSRSIKALTETEFGVLEDEDFKKRVADFAPAMLEQLELLHIFNSSAFNRSPVITSDFPEDHPEADNSSPTVLESADLLLHRFFENEGIDKHCFAVAVGVSAPSFEPEEKYQVVKQLYSFGLIPDDFSLPSHDSADISKLVDSIIEQCSNPGTTVQYSDGKQLLLRIDCMAGLRDLFTRPMDDILTIGRRLPRWRNVPKSFRIEDEIELFETLLKSGMGTIPQNLTVHMVFKRIRLYIESDEGSKSKSKSKTKPKPKATSTSARSKEAPRPKLSVPSAQDIPKIPPKAFPRFHKKGKAFGFEDIKRDAAGNLTTPFAISQFAYIHSLGTIVRDRPGFKSKTYYYPAGYVSSRLYASPENPEVRTRWISEVLDTGGDGPIFRVWMEDDPSICFEGTSSTTPWSNVLRYVNQFRKDGANRTNSISGPEAFLFTAPAVTKALIAMEKGTTALPPCEYSESESD